MKFFRYVYLFLIATLILYPPKGLLSASVTTSASQTKLLLSKTSAEQQLWEAWVTRYTLKLPQGIVVLDPFTHRMWSEGSAHGLLLSVQFNDQTRFDAILQGLDSNFLNKNGLFSWEITDTGQKIPEKWMSASESEINILFALLQANTLVRSGIWKSGINYWQRAEALNRAMWNHEIFQSDSLVLLLPSDEIGNPYWPIQEMPGGKKIVWAPTYFNPAFIKKFAKAFPECRWQDLLDSETQLFSEILNNSDSLLKNSAGVVPVLPIPAWVYVVSQGSSYTIQNYFLSSPHPPYSNEYDAIRIPMYIGLDALWNQSKTSKKWLLEFLNKTSVQIPSQARVGADPGSPTGYNSELAIAMFGVAHKVSGNPVPFQKTMENYLQDGKASFGPNIQYYYNQTFCLYAYLILNNKFLEIVE